jgi:undecaprenyl-diphosphatase
MSGIYVTYGLAISNEHVIWGELMLGVVLSFLAAYLCIYLFLSFIERCGMLPFVIYRLILGAALLFAALG